eukprot:jgi/Psemu1/19596/gm1.19596_g
MSHLAGTQADMVNATQAQQARAHGTVASVATQSHILLLEFLWQLQEDLAAIIAFSQHVTSLQSGQWQSQPKNLLGAEWHKWNLLGGGTA